MFVYISSPYTAYHDKEAVMRTIEKYMAAFIKANPGMYPVTGLHGHYIARHDIELGTNWATWQGLSEKYLSISCKVIVLKLPGWNTSTGVAGELAYAEKHGIPVEYVEIVLDV